MQLKLQSFILAAVAVALTSAAPVPTPGEVSKWPGTPPPSTAVGNGNTCSVVNGQGNKIKCEYELSEDSDTDGLLKTVNSLLGGLGLLGRGDNAGNSRRGWQGPGAPPIIVGNGNTCSSVNGQGNKIKCEYEVSEDSEPDVNGLLDTVNGLLSGLFGGGEGAIAHKRRGQGPGVPPTIVSGNGNICSVVNGQGNKIECTVEVSQDSDSSDEGLLDDVNNLLGGILGAI